mgnify:CR=1 FL=1
MNKLPKYIICCFLLISSSVYTQDKLKLGLNIGGQLTSLRGFEFEVEDDFEIAPFFGVNIEVKLFENLYVVTAFNFETITKKTELAFYDSSSTGVRNQEVKEKYEFFNIPLQLRWKFGSNKMFFIDTGGFMNYFNKGKPNGFTPLFINFENYNYGISFGAGAVFPITRKTDLSFQIRNDLGLSRVNKFQNQIPGEIKTNTLRISATYSFGF